MSAPAQMQSVKCRKCDADIKFTDDEWLQLIGSILDRARRRPVLCRACETAYQKRSTYQKRYYAAHKAEKRAYNAKRSEQIKAYKKIYRAEHQERIRAYERDYYWLHREELIARVSTYKLKKKLVARLGYWPEGNKPDFTPFNFRQLIEATRAHNGGLKNSTYQNH